MTELQITDIDHIVLNVKDVERSLAFYTGVLGLQGERVEAFRSGEVGFPSIRVNGNTIIDLSPLKGSEVASVTSTRNLGHFCLVTAPTDMTALRIDLEGQGVTVLRGPVSPWGARGRATAIYILDPDENEIELRCY